MSKGRIILSEGLHLSPLVRARVFESQTWPEGFDLLLDTSGITLNRLSSPKFDTGLESPMMS